MTSDPPEPDLRSPADELPLLDEDAAWRLVRAVRPGAGGLSRGPDRKPDVPLQVYPSGAWNTKARLTGAARQVFDLFLPLQARADLVVAQAGQSLDGRIATAAGHSHYVTGPGDIRRLHRLRALVDAVIVGAGAVAADDPRLTVREADGDNPLRVVIDPNGRLDRSRRVFRDGAAPTVVIRRRPDAGPGRPPPARDAPPRGAAAELGGGDELPLGIAGPRGAGAEARRAPSERPAPRGAGAERVDVVELPCGPSGTIDPRDVLAALRERGCRRFLIEGGGVTVSRFLAAGAVDRLHVAVAPLLIGSGRPAFTLAPIATLEQALRPACRVFRLGDDVLFDLDLRSPAPAAWPAGRGGPR